MLLGQLDICMKNSYVALYTNKLFEVDQDLNIKFRIIKFLEENIMWYIHNHRVGYHFLKKTQKVKTVK